MKLRENYTCPLEFVHDIIKGKWKTIIIFQLRKGKCSFSELHREISGISQKMLLEQLKELRKFGFVDKKSYSGYPLQVEYFLTERGEKILSAVKIMQDIGIEYMIENNMTEFLDKKGIKYNNVSEYTKK
ncbi:winged helix-turn-helix transcriptional regulator [Pseudoleptotrichia goodfellowii]|uniref:Transcriptional regulator n=1 Tax=Pseudoleptotrichia goodfellowii TaxID=157692 RepID=A0A510J9P8_9FUSO|nr:helix-turn-helix domain-containing protein [Pseudoleptotrichia goodfellowii]BBM36059.1 transcriptional regulator [Pseudoleptotrichia goodfellowii]